MAQITQMLPTVLARNLRLLQPHQLCCQQMINFHLSKCRYSEKIHEASKVKENVHFLKMQRKRLKELRRKIIKERELIKEKIAELDEEILAIKKKSGVTEEEKILEYFTLDSYAEILNSKLRKLCLISPAGNEIFSVIYKCIDSDIATLSVYIDHLASERALNYLKKQYKQLNNLKKKKIDQRRHLDERIKKLQERIEKIKEYMRKKL